VVNSLGSATSFDLIFAWPNYSATQTRQNYWQPGICWVGGMA